jgi:PAS domain S-box-containing protein
MAPPPLLPVPLDLMDELAVGVVVTQRTGSVLAVNRAAAEMLGRPQAELVGKNMAVFTHPDDVARRSSSGALGPGQTATERRRLLHKDGSYRLAEERVRPLADGRIVSVVRDVTASAGAEHALHESEDRLLFIANAAPALIAYVDTEARYVWANETYRRWFGHPPEKIRGRHVSEVLGGSAWAMIRPQVERVLSGEEITFEDRLVYSSGPARDVRASYVPHRDGSGRVRGFVGLVTDITEVRKAEVALRRSERMLEESQRAAHVGSWEQTLPGGQRSDASSLLWSDETYRMFGFEPGSVEATYPLFVASIHPDDRETVRAVSTAGLRRGERFEKEYRVVRPDGAVRVIHAWTSIESDASGTPARMLGTCQDITERKLAEQEGRQAREQLQLVMDSTAAIITRCDRERRIVWANKSSAARFGKTPEEMVGRSLREIVGEAAYRVLDKFSDRVLTGETFEVDVEVPYPTMASRWEHVVYSPTLDPAGAPDGWVSVVTDNTHRRELERTLRLSEERYRSLVGAITSVVWTANARGEFVAPQTPWEAYTGQSWQQHEGRGWVGAVHPDDRERIEGLWTQAVRTGTLDRFPCRVWHASSAEYRFCEGSAVAMRNLDGSVREWIGTLVDVHERECALQELKEADRRKDTFLAMLSHELRNPLSPILNAVEILSRVGAGDPKMAARYRAVIVRQVQHMKRLLDDLLDVSRVSQDKIQLRKERLDLSALLVQALEVSRPLIIEKEQKLSVSLARGSLPVEADPTRIVQVFANLLNNAAKYSDRGGHIAVGVTVEGDEAVVKVRDDGVGMSQELLDRAFDLFMQETRSLDRAQGGLGIGLTMVRSLVKMHGGSVRAFSEGLGRGSELVVRLPLAPAAAAAPAARDAPLAAEATGGPLRVLVVDDNVDAARSLGDLLALLGHEVTLAHDGPAALAIAVSAPPELVLIDIGLPGMDGYAVAEALRKVGLEGAALIAVTGYGREEDVRRAREAGFDRHLTKPVEFAVLHQITTELRGSDRGAAAAPASPSRRGRPPRGLGAASGPRRKPGRRQS